MRKPPTKAEITAAALTAVLTLLLLLALFLGSLDYDRASLAADSVPEPDEPMQEELFLDPPLVIGADDASLRESAEPEASPLGLPDQAPVENDVVRTSGENRNPEARSTEKHLLWLPASAARTAQRQASMARPAPAALARA